MKYPAIIICLLSIFQSLPSFSQTDLGKVRELYIASIEDEEKAVSFHKFIMDVDEESPLINGFKGVSYALLSKHAFNPYNKIDYLNTSLEKMGEAIEKAPDDIELRFLRFSVLHYVPSFLGYSDDMGKDLEVIVANFHTKHNLQKPERVRELIYNFLLDSGRLNKDQKKLLTSRE